MRATSRRKTRLGPAPTRRDDGAGRCAETPEAPPLAAFEATIAGRCGVCQLKEYHPTIYARLGEARTKRGWGSARLLKLAQFCAVAMGVELAMKDRAIRYHLAECRDPLFAVGA